MPETSNLGLLEQALENPVFAGGFGLASMGAALAFARKGAIATAGLIRRQLQVTVEIGKQDPAYPWILAWLSQPRPQASFLADRLTRVKKLSVATTTQSVAPDGPVKASFLLQHGYGRHLIKYKYAYIAVNREKQSTARTNTGEPHETVELTTLYAHRHIFEDIFREAHADAVRAREGKTLVYSVRNFDWVPVGEPKMKRLLKSVVLDRGVKESIVADVQDFLRRRSWYADRGIPYRRGYLLHGPPGSGKTSFIHALAGELDYSVAMVNLSEIGVTDDKLAFLLAKLPERTILLLEDIDAAFVNRTPRGADGYSGPTVTHSGLLNALDGLTAGEDRIAFLTTNHPERLDAALTRPGRVDMHVRIGEATRYQATQMWDNFYGEVDTHGAGRERFLRRLDELKLFEPGHQTSAAAIQGLFMFNKDDMEGAIQMAEGLVPQAPEP